MCLLQRAPGCLQAGASLCSALVHGPLCSATARAALSARLPSRVQERQAAGRLFKGFFEKSTEALYEEPPAQQQQQAAVDPAVAEATDELLRSLERRERRASLLRSRGLLAAVVVGLLAVLLAVAARSWLPLAYGAWEG